MVQGDMTQQEVDAVVNAANRAMRGGAGVDGAIHRVGGPAVLEDCRRRFPRRARDGRRGLDDGRRPARSVGHPRRRTQPRPRRDRPLAAHVVLLPRAGGRRRAGRAYGGLPAGVAPAPTAGPRTTPSPPRSTRSAPRPRGSRRPGSWRFDRPTYDLVAARLEREGEWNSRLAHRQVWRETVDVWTTSAVAGRSEAARRRSRCRRSAPRRRPGRSAGYIAIRSWLRPSLR